MRDIGTEYLTALSAAQDAKLAFETNGGDNYDPSGETKRRVTQDYDVSIARLAKATKALIELARNT